MIARRVAVLFVVSAVALAVYAQVRTVSRVRIVARPAVYNGPCPATITFTATIFVNRRPARVTYEWERSDGARSPRQTVDINAAGRGVSETWTLGGARERRRVWEVLHVVAPTGISSPKGFAQINCR